MVPRNVVILALLGALYQVQPVRYLNLPTFTIHVQVVETYPVQPVRSHRRRHRLTHVQMEGALQD